MGVLMRSIDWSRTRIASVESWSPVLRMMVRFLLANRFPMLLWWGSEFCPLYNEPYRPVLGTKHPQSIGQPASQCRFARLGGCRGSESSREPLLVELNDKN